MRINFVGAVRRNAPFATELAFSKGFDRLGGHQLTLIDPGYPDQKWDYDADVTVVFKWLDAYVDDLQRCGGKKVVFQPDDMRFPHVQQMMRGMREYCDYALTFDRSGAQAAVDDFGYLAAARLIVTADDDLYHHVPRTKKDVDVCFVGSLSSGPNHVSRVKMCELVQSLPGVTTYFSGGLYDMDEMVRVYNSSKVIVNHATDVGQPFGRGFGYQCRHFETGFTRACLLSNRTDETDIKNFWQFGDEEEFVDRLQFLLSRPDVREATAHEYYRELKTAHRPEHRAQDMLEFFGSLS